MSSVRGPARHDPEVHSLGDRAVADLAYIRTTIQSSGRFTAVSGRGTVGVGVIALIATWIADLQTTPDAWVGVWMATSVLAAATGLLTLRAKARRDDLPVLSGLGRKFLLGLCPPLLAGAVLTGVLHSAGLVSALPTTWLLLYGAGVVAAGTFSVPVVPVTGAAFMGLGVVAAIAPATWGNPLLGIGFGGFHVASGVWIARRHGG